LVDLVVVSQNEPLIYLHNRTRRPGRFVVIQLEGAVSNRDGIGAQVTLESGGAHQVSYCVGGGSYLAASDRRVHFGLGAGSSPVTVTVHWPSGRSDRWQNLAANGGYTLREGSSQAKPLVGFTQAYLSDASGKSLAFLQDPERVDTLSGATADHSVDVSGINACLRDRLDVSPGRAYSSSGRK
jgi:hypothetical protein